jgi:hypothetical protein
MKKTLMIGAVMLVVILLSGCAKRGAETSPASDFSSNSSSEEDKSAPSPTPQTQTEFYDGRGFSDGAVWVRIAMDSNWKCVDEKGKALFSLAKGETPKTDFVSGGAVVEMLGSANKNIMKIVDKNGEVVFPKEDDENEYTFLISSGNANFVRRHVNTFEKTEDQTGIVDNSGEWVVKPTADLSVDWQAKAYDGIINRVKYNDDNFYDAVKNDFFKSDYDSDNYLKASRRFVEHRYQEGLIYLHAGSNKDTLTFLFPGQAENDMSFNYSYYESYQNAFRVGFDIRKTGFYDENRKLAIDLSSYADGAFAIGGFSGGYATLRVKNPQGNSFWTVIDKEGKKMFDPIPDQLGKVACGRILATPSNKENTEYYIDVNGETIIQGIKTGSDFGENCLAKIGSGDFTNQSPVYYIDADGNTAF